MLRAVAAQTKGAGAGLSTFAKTGALALGAVAAGSVKLAADFEKSMRNVNSIAKLPEPAFDRLNDQVLALAGPTAQAPKTLADGLYDLVSSGFKSQDAMKVLEASAIAATAGLTTTDVAAKSVAGVLNAYKLPAEEAGHVSDVLFKIVDQGVISFEELASTVGKSLPIAAQLKIPIEDLGGALATLTKTSMSGAEANTAIRGAMVQLIKPTEGLKAAFKELGVESGDELIQKTGSLQGALEALVGTTDGGSEAIGKMFTNSRALSAVLAVTGKNAEGARKDLDNVGDSAGATQAAFAEQSKGLSVQLTKLKEGLTALAIEMGTAILPVLTEITQAMNTYLLPALHKIIDVAGPVFSFLNDKLGLMKSLFLTMFIGPIGFVVVALFKLKGVAVTVFNAIVSAARSVINFLRPAFNALKGFFVGVFNVIKAAGRVAFAVIKGAAQIAFNVIKVLTAPMRAVLMGTFRSIMALGRLAFGAIKAAGTLAFNVIKDATAPFRSVISSAFQAIKSVAVSVWNAIKSAATAVFGAIKSAMGPLKSAASATFGAIGDAINAVIGVVRDCIAAVQDLANAIADAINAASDLAGKVAGLPGKALDLINPFAAGGKIHAGEIGLVGEKGPELFVPSTTGRIVPNHRLAALGTGGGAAAITITNWKEGTGFIRSVSESSIAAHRLHDRQRRRMG